MGTAEAQRLIPRLEASARPQCATCPLMAENARLRDALAAADGLLATLGARRAPSTAGPDQAGPRTWEELEAYVSAREKREANRHVAWIVEPITPANRRRWGRWPRRR